LQTLPPRLDYMTSSLLWPSASFLDLIAAQSQRLDQF
jgi:hypothetical protein